MIKKEMSPSHRLLFMFVMRCIIQRGEGRDEATSYDMAMMELLDREAEVNLPSLMIQYIERVVDPKQRPHSLPYGF